MKEETFTILRESPQELLTSKCVIALEGFLNGYSFVDPSLSALMRRLELSLHGPSSMSLCTRALLTLGDSSLAYDYVLDVLQADISEFVPEPDGRLSEFNSHVNRSFISAIDREIQTDRIVFVLGNEQTIHQLYNCASGHVSAHKDIHPAEGARQESEMARFQIWVENKFGHHASWHEVIRIFFGMCNVGIKQCALLWSEFKATDALLQSSVPS